MAVLIAALVAGTAPDVESTGAVLPAADAQAHSASRPARSSPAAGSLADASASSASVSRARQPVADAQVDVRILSKHRPARLRLDGPRSLEVVASGNTLVVDGRPQPHALRLDAGRWHVRGRGLDRRYESSLSLEAQDGELIVVATFALETYVAAVTASETEVDTPFEALRAQAITARSYVLASGKRHDEARACDLTHCQVLRGEGFARHLRRARDAARLTEGVVLRLPSGAVALAPFHASCGGHTAEPVAVFGAPDLTGAAAVPDRCPASPWRAVVPRALVTAAASAAVGGPAQAEDLLLDRDSSGAVVRIVDRASGREGRGDAFFRALGARAGWDRIRSARFSMTLGGDQALLEGQGHGHGVGLCQAGAALLARQGWTAEQVLAHYFPRALLEKPQSK
ncbi:MULTISPECIES: SpoIID/LytB domain-containing protein [unclassified Corallococcus]|uniref:SpoIID/LytB domain-containing protein n=1 Tax=unclassified Corallococcus TaxID=2685029 RepID=UPI001A8E7797|nr:SpoIID/LytB domain-containing protein [Corallococcus sp. NCRR]MBN9684886.1 SpoIID/LytB domain-containing protein [Corallococcus sp. NCSPR001]WAS83650.1 SpoIID/LytB domain-containing protein [Corallococcus sp. NCRR]